MSLQQHKSVPTDDKIKLHISGTGLDGYACQAVVYGDEFEFLNPKNRSEGDALVLNASKLIREGKIDTLILTGFTLTDNDMQTIQSAVDYIKDVETVKVIAICHRGLAPTNSDIYDWFYNDPAHSSTYQLVRLLTPGDKELARFADQINAALGFTTPDDSIGTFGRSMKWAFDNATEFSSPKLRQIEITYKRRLVKLMKNYGFWSVNQSMLDEDIVKIKKEALNITDETFDEGLVNIISKAILNSLFISVSPNFDLVALYDIPLHQRVINILLDNRPTLDMVIHIEKDETIRFMSKNEDIDMVTLSKPFGGIGTSSHAVGMLEYPAYFNTVDKFNDFVYETVSFEIELAYDEAYNDKNSVTQLPDKK